VEKAPDQSSPATITTYPDGPYLVRGEFVVQDQDGKELPLDRQTIALCRCGKSQMRPFCDGTHKLIGFRAPSSPEPWPAD
jgi:CDGSH-type Zn-finger protein